MAPSKPSSSSSQQATLLGFFKPKPADPSSSSPITRVATPAAAAAAAAAAKSAKLTISSSSKTPSSVSAVRAKPASSNPLTSDGDIVKQENSSSQSAAIPMKRAVVLESEDEEEERVGPPKKRSSTKKAIIESDSDEEVASSSKVKTKAKPKSKSKDDQSFAGSSASQDFFDDDDSLDGYDPDSSELQVLGKPDPKVVLAKPKPKSTFVAPPPSAAKKTPVSKPMSKASGSGNGSIKTKADLNKEKEKEKKSSNEKTFSFLTNARDADKIPHGQEGCDPRTLYIPQSAWNDFTPFEVQFWEIKQNHYDTVLFFQKGKFYELYEEDALIGHRDFDLKVTDRVKMKMAGVPEASFDFWAAKFLAKGYKVGRVDQCETALGAEMRVKDAKGKDGGKGKAAVKGKGIVRRELQSVLTTGTIVDGSMLTEELASHCVAIKEYTPDASTSPTFGVCVLDASTAEFSLSTFADDTCRTSIETLIRQLRPKELIHEKGNLSVTTLRMLRNILSIDCQWTALKPGTQFLRAEDTKEKLKELFGKGQENGMDIDGDNSAIPAAIVSMYDKPIAMEALGGMIWYLKQLNLDNELVTARNFNIYDPLRSGNALVLDGQTLAHIEVLQNSSGGPEGTLLQLLSRCVTPYGKRLFLIWLCHPLRDVAGINDRLDAVEDLMKHSDFGSRFDTMVKGLPDLERLISRIHAKTCKRKEFIKIMAAFETISEGIDSLSSQAEEFASQGVPALLRTAPDLSEMLENLNAMFEGGDQLLPVEGKDEEFEGVRQAVADIEESLQDTLTEYKSELNCKSIIFRDIGTKDIYQVQVPSKTKVPKNWTKMSNTKDFDRYYSPAIETLVQELKEARERRTAVVNEFQFRVYAEFDKDYSTWMQAIKLVAELDCLLSLAKASVAIGEPAVRPEIVESDAAIVEFEGLRHPCVLSATIDFIPNDVKLGGEAEQMVLLTGPNMAGKSTMLRMTCAAIIMAQLGCYVPATKARISPIDAIYSRMGANDFIFANASTFKVEMDDTTKILKKATPKSLVILDELGRGTSTYDGMAIAFSVLHRLATHVGCIGFFATHFTSLTEDFAYHPQIRLCNMLTDVDDVTKMVVFLYKLVEGSSPKSYGPHVAAMAGLSDVLVQRAIDISKKFEETSRAHERKMRASESLALTSQADAAFLLRIERLGIEASHGGASGIKQLKRTIEMIGSVARKEKAKTLAMVV